MTHPIAVGLNKVYVVLWKDQQFFNIWWMGLAFLLIYSGFTPASMVQTLVLDSYVQNEDPNFKGDGYTSLAIIYIVFALANWVVPSLISIIGPKYSMILGAITYVLYIATYLKPMTWSLYLGSVIIGLGAACIWTGQGNFLTINSTSETIARNSGIFWAMMQCSMLFGNLFVFFEFKGSETISKSSRFTVFAGLLAAAVVGLVLMFFFRMPAKESASEDAEKRADASKRSGPLQAFVMSLKLMSSRDMILLSFCFFYSGIELGFFSGVYGTCIGFTKSFGANAKQYVGINGMLIGAGEILGGTVFGLLGKRSSRRGRDVIVLLGYIIHVICFFLVFINMPSDSPIQETYESAYIESNVYIALLCSFLFGFADSCFNTQIFSILGFMYPDNSAAAFAIMKFMQSLAAAINFFYSTTLYLGWQLLILLITGTVGTLTFCYVEWELFVKKKRELRMAATVEDGF